MRLSGFKWYFSLVSLLCSCTKVINVNLNDVSPNIVIEGYVTNQPGPYTVQITQTVNFSASNTFPPVTGAIVKITDSTSGLTDSLVESSSGIYSTKNLLQGLPGHTYQLFVSANGKDYTSSSTMPKPVLMDSLTFYKSSVLGRISYNAVANFLDPFGIPNYYTFKEYMNNKQLNQSFEFSDRLSDGKYIRLELFNDSSYLQPGAEVMVVMNCVDRNVWNYFNTLRQATGNNFQSVTPTNPISNISNNALGYFSAQTEQNTKAVLE
jgi:hypothetical protein